MFRIFSIFALLTACCCFLQIDDHWGDRKDVAILKDKRLLVLLERTRIIEARVNKGQATRVELAAPMIDLIRAKIEYSNSNKDRRALYDQWLQQHDLLIESAEFRGKAPVSVERTKLELLHLQSERLKIEIARESLK